MNLTIVKNTKPFSWSFSRLKSFEVCPRRYNEVDVLKNWAEERSEALSWGDEVHAAMATALKTGKELPLQFAMYQPWIDKVNRTKGTLLVEDQCRWAITRDFKPTAWFAKSVWARSIADAVKIDDNIALAVDWKTGKSQNADEVQLIMTSLVMFIQFPKLLRVRAEFVWLQEDEHTTLIVDRSEARDHWSDIVQRVAKLEQAVIDDNFPPKPNNFCRKYCPVKTCEYYGK